MKNFLKLFFGIIKVLLCSIFTLIFGVWSTYILIIALTHPSTFDWQMMIFAIFSLFIIIGIWLISFIKTTKIVKIIYSILLILYIFMPYILPSVMKQIDIDICIDTGICAEGVRFGNDIVSKEYCLKHGKKWDEKNKSCDFNEKIMKFSK